MSVCVGTTHSFAEEEKLAFVDWINFQLENDTDLSKILPIPEEGTELFSAVKDGLILWYRLINIYIIIIMCF